jgi:hypothetical protein
VSDQSFPSPIDDTSDSHSPMYLVFQMQLGSISSINDRLELKASLPFRFKVMNTCDDSHDEPQGWILEIKPTGSAYQ